MSTILSFIFLFFHLTNKKCFSFISLFSYFYYFFFLVVLLLKMLTKTKNEWQKESKKVGKKEKSFYNDLEELVNITKRFYFSSFWNVLSFHNQTLSLVFIFFSFPYALLSCCFSHQGLCCCPSYFFLLDWHLRLILSLSLSRSHFLCSWFTCEEEEDLFHFVLFRFVSFVYLLLLNQTVIYVSVYSSIVFTTTNICTFVLPYWVGAKV